MVTLHTTLKRSSYASNAVKGTCAMLACALLLCAAAARADVIYNNSVNDRLVKLNPGTLEVGDEIVLAGTARYLTNFTFEYWGTSLVPGVFAGNVEVCVRFYLNNGVLFNGYPTPGTAFFDSGWFSIQPTDRSVLQLVAGPQFSPSGTLLPASQFTWSVQFRGLGIGDAAGVDLYGPITAGLGYPDYWVRTPTGWQLEQNQTTPMNFAALMEASTTSVVTRPPIHITQLPPDKAVVSWPSWATTFELQITSAVVGAPWTPITSGIDLSQDGLFYIWTNTVTAGSKAFFRLHHVP